MRRCSGQPGRGRRARLLQRYVQLAVFAKCYETRGSAQGQSLNRRLCDEILNIHQFVTLHYAREKLKAW